MTTAWLEEVRPAVTWALERAPNPQVVLVHTTVELTRATIEKCPPASPPEGLRSLLTVDGVRCDSGLHRAPVHRSEHQVTRRMLEDGTELKVVTGIDDHSRFCVIARLVARATARPVCDALMEGLSRHGAPEQILTDNAKVFTARLARKPSTVAFDRICQNNGIRHILTAPYSPTTTGKIERLHKTMRKELFSQGRSTSIEQAQADLDAWVLHYNFEREHQALGDTAPIRRFELADTGPFEVTDPDAPVQETPQPRSRAVGRRVDRAGRISILKHRYHVGRYLAGQTVSVESTDGLLHVSNNGVLVATHARRHLAEDDDRMDRRAKTSRPRRPTRGNEVLRKVDPSGSVSFAGTSYRVGNRYLGHVVGVRLVADTVQITHDGTLVRTHRAGHDKS